MKEGEWRTPGYVDGEGRDTMWELRVAKDRKRTEKKSEEDEYQEENEGKNTEEYSRATTA